jgi:hypothetical protein
MFQIYEVELDKQWDYENYVVIPSIHSKYAFSFGFQLHNKTHWSAILQALEYVPSSYDVKIQWIANPAVPILEEVNIITQQQQKFELRIVTSYNFSIHHKRISSNLSPPLRTISLKNKGIVLRGDSFKFSLRFN